MMILCHSIIVDVTQSNALVDASNGCWSVGQRSGQGAPIESAVTEFVDRLRLCVVDQNREGRFWSEFSNLRSLVNSFLTLGRGQHKVMAGVTPLLQVWLPDPRRPVVFIANQNIEEPIIIDVCDTDSIVFTIIRGPGLVG